MLSGAIFPDWSVVSSDRVRASLGDTLDRLRMVKQWTGMSGNEEVVRLAILNFYTREGHAPSHRELAAITGFKTTAILGLLEHLEGRDLIVLNTTDRSIEVSYPFTDRSTEHRVMLGDVTLNAMCAIDALGTGAMLNRDAIIESSCRHCQCRIRIETKNNGRAVRPATPDGAIVWSGFKEIDGCAADMLCTVMAFFCSDEHLDSWRDGNAAGKRGHRLSIDEGLQAGMAIFIPFTADGPAAA